MRAVGRFVAIGTMFVISGCAPATTPIAMQTPPPPPVAQAPVAAAAPAKPADAGQKVVCKRVPIVGSNVGTERVCTPRGDSQKSSDGQ